VRVMGEPKVLFMEEPVALLMDIGSMHMVSMHMVSMDMVCMDMVSMHMVSMHMGSMHIGSMHVGSYGGAFMAGCLARLWRRCGQRAALT